MITINEQAYEYPEILTVSEVFRKACLNPRFEYLASLDETFILRSKWDATPVPDGSSLVFIPISSGG